MRLRTVTSLLTIALLIMALLSPIAVQAQTEPDETYIFGGGRYDNGAYLVSLGALFDNVELVPGVLDVDVGPLSSIWYTDVFSTLWKDQPNHTSSISFELAVKTSLLTERLTGGLTLGTSFEQQETGSSIADYFAAATGGFAAYNVAKTGSRTWGPWGYVKYKSGLESGYTDGFQLGVGFFARLGP